MLLNPKIFRAYDIRGEAFVDFDEDGFYMIAQAYGQYIAKKFNIKKPKIFVSGDGRLSMPALFPAVITGLTASGANVTWGGTLTTPINFFALHDGGFDASIQISASHNPAPDNGLKLTDRNGAVCGDEIQKIMKLAQCVECTVKQDFGTCIDGCTKVDFSLKYNAKIKAITPSQSPLKVVIDAGNGVSGIFYPNVLEAHGHEVVRLFCDLDGTFPNHQPDPERLENLKWAQEKLREEKADMAFVYDGDGDRVGIILRDGTMLNADKIMYVMASDFLTRNPGEKIILDAMTSATLIEKIKKLGGVPIVSKTGHSFIEEAMHEHGALLGGEQSGHFMFGENFYGHDDACLASLRFIQAIESNPQLIDEVTTHWPNLLEFSEKVTVADEMKFEILDQVKAKLLAADIDGKINTIDGVRIDWADGEWAIIRCSNTSPKIAIRIEAKDEDSLDEKRMMLLGILESFL